MKFAILSPPVEGSVMIRAESTKSLKTIYYAIIGQKVKHNKITLTKEGKYFSFAVKLTSDMSSSSRVIVYYTHETGEIIYDSIALPFAPQLKNHVS